MAGGGLTEGHALSTWDASPLIYPIPISTALPSYQRTGQDHLLSLLTLCRPCSPGLGALQEFPGQQAGLLQLKISELSHTETGIKETDPGAGDNLTGEPRLEQGFPDWTAKCLIH